MKDYWETTISVCSAPKPKARKRVEIVKTRAKINETENRNIIVEINETKSSFFEKINRIGKSLTGWTKEKKREDSKY